MANAAEKAFADRAILLDENQLLFEQNNEKTTRLSIRSTVVGSTKVMSYDDIIEAQRKRDLKDAPVAKRPHGGHQPRRATTRKGERSQAEELEDAGREIQALGWTGFVQFCNFELRTLYDGVTLT